MRTEHSRPLLKEANNRKSLNLRRLIVLLFLAVLLYFPLKGMLWRPLPVAGQAPEDGFIRVAGAIHAHSILSDGGGTPEDIIKAAQKNRLSFLFITDHNNLDAKTSEGYHGNLLVVVGSELSTEQGHVLGLGIPDPQFRFSDQAKDVLEDIRDLGGIAFAAHPLSSRTDFNWTGWNLPGNWGMEIINEDSQWRSAGRWSLGKAALMYPFNSRYALLSGQSAPRSTLRKWDEMLQQRDVPGIAGADAHQKLQVKKNFVLKFPSYKSILGIAENHVLLKSPLSGNVAADTKALLDALKSGRSYMAVDGIAPANDFYFQAFSGAQHWTMGQTIPAGVNVSLSAGGRIPKGARLQLIHNGRLLSEQKDKLGKQVSESGVYRIEVRLEGWDIPWIISNPIYVFDSTSAGRRASAAAWPPETPAPPAARTLESFQGATKFITASDTDSTVNKDVIDPNENAGRLEFRLAHPSVSHPFVWCALVDSENRDLSGNQGMQFSIKGNGTYRIWFQVRDENPAANEEGTEWWFTSVKITPQWKQVAVPFSVLRSANAHTDGKLDLNKVKAIVFVLDQGAVKPGTEGTIWFRNLAVY